jgi:hypothetical protein
MAALTAYAYRRYRPGGFSWLQNWPVLNTNVIFIGSWVGLADPLLGVTANKGYAMDYTNTGSIRWLGPAVRSNYESAADRDANKVTGATGNSPPPEVWTEGGPIVLEQQNIAGVTAQTNLGQFVYASNDNDLTLTQGNTRAIGRIVYFNSTTQCDVLVYGFMGDDVAF